MKTITKIACVAALMPLSALAANMKLVNDTGQKVSIHTGSGFVSLNKGSSTSMDCRVGKEVRWAEKGSKKGLIFKIKANQCGKTVKLSNHS